MESRRTRTRDHHAQCSPVATVYLLGALLAFGGLFALGSETEDGHETLANGSCHYLVALIASYGVSTLVAACACITSCCAGQCGFVALQVAILDIMIVYPLNFTLRVLFYVLTPVRIALQHVLTWLSVPFVSIFHLHPSLKDATLDKLIRAVPFAFAAIGLQDFMDAPEEQVRPRVRQVIQSVLPRLTKWFPDAMLTNSIVRIAIGFMMTPLAWWLCDEMQMIPLSQTNDPQSANKRGVRPGDDRRPVIELEYEEEGSHGKIRKKPAD